MERSALQFSQDRRFLDSIVSSFFDQPLADACDALLYRHELAEQNGTALSCFEDYAVRLLRAAGADKLRALTAHNHIVMGRLQSTGLGWLRFNADEMTDEEVNLLLSIESIINRLLLMVTTTEPRHWAVLASPAEDGSACHQDWLLYACITKPVLEFLRAFERPNDLQTMGETTAWVGGEWDVRTRFAQMIERVILPARMEYHFGCDASKGLFQIDVTAPIAGALPPFTYNDHTREWASTQGITGMVQAGYTAILACLIASIAFGTSAGISRVVVSAHDERIDGPIIFSSLFDRTAFINSTLPYVQRGAAALQFLEFQPKKLLDTLNISQWELSLSKEGQLQSVIPFSLDIPQRCKLDLSTDDRPIPLPLRTVLHADAVSDLDIQRQDDPKQVKEVMEAINEIREFPMATQLTLEQIVSDFEKKQRSNKHYLYSSSSMGRLLVGMYDSTEERFLKYPDAVFTARAQLSLLYQSDNNWEAALEQAQVLVQVGPTSSLGYLDLSTIFVQMGEYAKAADALKHLLCVQSDWEKIHYTYYRLAYVLFLMGNIEAALAAYVLAIKYGGSFVEHATKELQDIMARIEGIGIPTVERACTILEQNQIPLAPTGTLRNYLCDLAIRLVDAGLFNCALPAIAFLGSQENQDVLMSVIRSLMDPDDSAADIAE